MARVFLDPPRRGKKKSNQVSDGYLEEVRQLFCKLLADGSAPVFDVADIRTGDVELFRKLGL